MKKTEKLIEREQNDRRDSDRNGIDDRFEPPIPDVSAGSHQLAERLRENHGMDPSLSGGDIDARWEMAESQGDEAATGSQSTPEQNNTDEIGEAMGITYADDEELKAWRERSRNATSTAGNWIRRLPTTTRNE